MDRDFRMPEDVARSTSDRVEQSLVRVLRQGVEGRPFVLRLRFQYRGGRAAPLLYIGNLNRGWADYLDSNARATDLMSGTCTTRPREVGGGTLITLDVTRGRGATSGNMTEVNRWLRGLSSEIAYADEASAAATGTPPAATTAEAPAAGSPATESSPSSQPDLAANARVIKERFEAFKAAPSEAQLTELNALIDAWRTGLAANPELQGSKAAGFVEKLHGLLAAKGKSFVASAKG